MRVHANRDSALVLAAQASKAVPKITTIPELKGIHMEADARLAMRLRKRRTATAGYTMWMGSPPA